MRTKKMILTTLVAIVVITAALMSTALAAPATTNCPLKSALANGSISPSTLTGALPTGTSTCPKQNLLNQLLGAKAGNTAVCPNGNCTTGTCTTGACVTANCKSGSTCPVGTCTAGTTAKTCPSKALLQNMLNGNANLSSLLSGLK